MSFQRCNKYYVFGFGVGPLLFILSHLLLNGHVHFSFSREAEREQLWKQETLISSTAKPHEKKMVRLDNTEQRYTVT